VLKDLPEKQIMRVPVELTREQRRLYNKIRDEFIMILDSGEHKKITDVLPHIMRLKQACFSPELYGGSKHSAKIEELHAAVEQLVASGEKAIIGSEWSKATKILYREFEKYNPAYVDGSVTGKNRMLQADRFNKDPNCHLYIGTIGANKESVSLGAATHVILTDKDWSPFINDQFIARSAAGGLRGLNSVVEHVTVLDLYGVDTYEERIEEMLNMKRDNFNAFIENDGGEKVNKSVLTNIRDLI
jgi:SNF2 family DNA or RNA helicase